VLSTTLAHVTNATIFDLSSPHQQVKTTFTFEAQIQYERGSRSCGGLGELQPTGSCCWLESCEQLENLYILTKLAQAKGVLQDLVVVVSLVRTLTESFGSASDLYRKLKRKSKPDSHSSGDEKEERHKRQRKPLRRRRNSSSESDHERSHRRPHVSWNLGSKKDDFSDSDEELVCTSSSQVLAEYDRGYRKLGEPFARGDCTSGFSVLLSSTKVRQC
jgi:hypothetical protein